MGMPRDPFEFESEWLNAKSETKQLPNYHSSDFEKSVEWPNVNLATVLSPNYYSAVQTQTTQTDLRYFENTNIFQFSEKHHKSLTEKIYKGTTRRSATGFVTIVDISRNKTKHFNILI